jgi:signal transduction histidine kinase
MSAKSQLFSPVVADRNISSSLTVPTASSDVYSTMFLEKAKAGRQGFLLRLINSTWERLVLAFDEAAQRSIPDSSVGNPETSRRARLICRFGHLGAVFGIIYAFFYSCIGHNWGALVVVFCSTGFGFAPWLMKRTGSLDIAGNILSLILVLGFSALCCLEGGMQGHAIAWLASVPLCSLLLLGRTGAGRWMIASFAACAIIVTLALTGVTLRPTYDPKWEGLVSAAGYLGLILFMFMLGVIFETGRKRAFGKLQEALARLETSNAELVRLNQEKNEFLGIAAHDLKNPLGVVIGTAGLLRICQDESKNERLIGNIINAGTRMLHLVKNLLDANAIEEGRFTSNLERCDLHVLTRECLDNNLMAATGKEIRLELETNTPCWAWADRNATLQVLDNLVSNAVKYSPRKTTVHVRTTFESNTGVVTVRDEGPGISEEDLKKMFGKFTRLTARPTGGESSNGLGLSIVKRLSEAMNGTVRCESQLGQGAAFILQLPAAANE